jgi:predicted RNA-binding Zn-ribbon protein involved in translation (DUF1610 family)
MGSATFTYVLRCAKCGHEGQVVYTENEGAKETTYERFGVRRVTDPRPGHSETYQLPECPTCGTAAHVRRGQLLAARTAHALTRGLRPTR